MKKRFSLLTLVFLSFVFIAMIEAEQWDDDGWCHWKIPLHCETLYGDITKIDVIIMTELAGVVDTSWTAGISVSADQDTLNISDGSQMPVGSLRWVSWRVDQNGIKGEWAEMLPDDYVSFGQGASGCSCAKYSH